MLVQVTILLPWICTLFWKKT